MILVVSSVSGERAALCNLCEGHGWPALACDSVRALVRSLQRQAPRIVLVRQKLADGYSDDVLAHLRAAERLPDTRVIVLAGADAASSIEARQVALGADCVQHDPLRIDVLLAYLSKYYTDAGRANGLAKAAKFSEPLAFAGATVCPAERRLTHAGRTIQLTPREMTLVELFALSNGEVLTYEMLYSEILGRRFCGDTSNMRVLLGKLNASAAAIGIPLREWITVIPKTGYRYDAARVVTASASLPAATLDSHVVLTC